MFKTLVALVLALMMALAAYLVFWWSSLKYVDHTMQAVMQEVLGAKLEHGTVRWLPDVRIVQVALPQARLTFETGFLRELRGDEIVMETGFFSHGHWRLLLPPKVTAIMADGRELVLETQGGEVVYVADGGNLSVRGEDVVVKEGGAVLAHVRDVMLERRLNDMGSVRLNIASRPDMGGGEGVLSGALLLPRAVFVSVLEAVGHGAKTLPEILKVATHRLAQMGGEVGVENVSFKMQDVAMGLFGKVRVGGDGRWRGEMVVTGDKVARLTGWLQKAGMAMPQDEEERAGWQQMVEEIDPKQPMVRLEALQRGMMINGEVVGPVVKATETIDRLWR